MGFDIGGAISGAATGFLSGGPTGAAIGAAGGGFAGGGGGGGGGVTPIGLPKLDLIKKIKLSKSGRQLRKQVFTEIREGKFSTELSSALIGNELRAAGERQRGREKSLVASGSSPDVVRSNIGQVIGTGIGRVSEAGEGQRQVFEAERGFERNRFAGLSDIVGLERQKQTFQQEVQGFEQAGESLIAQATLINKQQERQAGAESGALLGLGAQLGGAALSKVDFSNIFAGGGGVNSLNFDPGGELNI